MIKVGRSEEKNPTRRQAKAQKKKKRIFLSARRHRQFFFLFPLLAIRIWENGEKRKFFSLLFSSRKLNLYPLAALASVRSERERERIAESIIYFNQFHHCFFLWRSAHSVNRSRSIDNSRAWFQLLKINIDHLSAFFLIEERESQGKFSFPANDLLARRRLISLTFWQTTVSK